jgi:invasion protein IalB
MRSETMTRLLHEQSRIPIPFSAHLNERGWTPPRATIPAALALLFGFSLLPSNEAIAQTSSLNVAGNWQLSCANKKGKERQVTLRIQQDGAVLSGTYYAKGGSGSLSGSMQGTQAALSAGAFTFNGAVAGNAMSGQNQKGRPCSASRE